jgi:hypothetical protein
VVLLTLGWLAVACSSVTAPKGTDLRGMVERFHHDLRWNYRMAASERVDPRHAGEFLDLLDAKKKDLHITQCEVRRLELSQDGMKASVRVNYRYYVMPSTVVREETAKQEWRLIGKRWLLTSQEGGPFRFPPQGSDESEAPDGGTAPTKDRPGQGGT